MSTPASCSLAFFWSKFKARTCARARGQSLASTTGDSTVTALDLGFGVDPAKDSLHCLQLLYVAARTFGVR